MNVRPPLPVTRGEGRVEGHKKALKLLLPVVSMSEKEI